MIRLFVIAKQQILLCCARVCFVQRRALPVVARVSECTPEQSPMTPSPPVHLMTSLASVRLSAGIQCFCHTFHSPKLRYLFNRLIFCGRESLVAGKTCLQLGFSWISVNDSVKLTRCRVHNTWKNAKNICDKVYEQTEIVERICTNCWTNSCEN